jgi:hypothetical protein
MSDFPAYVIVFIMFGIGAIILWWYYLVLPLLICVYFSFIGPIFYKSVVFFVIGCFSIFYAYRNPGGAQFQGAEGAFIASGVVVICLVCEIILCIRFLTTYRKSAKSSLPKLES